MMKCPCNKECPDRNDECHGTCERYHTWKAEHNKKLQWLKDQRPVVSDRAVKGYDQKAIRIMRGQERRG